jgi:hypothetical protein
VVRVPSEAQRTGEGLPPLRTFVNSIGQSAPTESTMALTVVGTTLPFGRGTERCRAVN